jgi:hypothetical protein
MIIPIIWKNKDHVPNHQPDMVEVPSRSLFNQWIDIPRFGRSWCSSPILLPIARMAASLTVLASSTDQPKDFAPNESKNS